MRFRRRLSAPGLIAARSTGTARRRPGSGSRHGASRLPGGGGPVRAPRLALLTARPDATPGPSPDRVAFVEALRKLPLEQRRALVLYHVCELTVEQIAAETGVPAGTVKARLARGRAALAHLRETAAPLSE
jgi:DNA-directed RNA polymerase specialized sigma24 family protein